MAEDPFSTGEVPTSAAFQAVLMQQVIVKCTSSMRGSTWTGKHIYETDDEIHRHWNGSAWKSEPSWFVGGALTGGGGIPLSATDLTGSEIVFNGYAGEQYVYECDVEASSTAAGSYYAVGLQYDFGGGYTGAGVQIAQMSLPTANVSARLRYRHIIAMGSTVAGAKVKAVITTSAGNGTWITGTPVSLEHKGSAP